MKAIRLKGSGGLERLTVVEMDEPGDPQEGEIRVRLHASSLNYHDYLVALGKIPTADGLIPLTDEAGIVVRIGEGVSKFAVGDHVVSCFFPEWQNGEAVSSGFPGPIPTVELLTRQVRLQGLTVGNRQQQIEMIRALDANDMKPVIDKTFPLHHLIEAFRYEASGAHFGKIYIEV